MFRICAFQLRRSLTSPKVYVALLIGAVMQIVSVTDLLDYSKAAGQPLNIFEGFVYFNCDRFTAAAAFLGLLFLASDIPFTSQNETFTLMRVSRRKWVLGKALYLLCACMLYYAVVFVFGMLFLSENACFASSWSGPIRQLVSGGTPGAFNVSFPHGHIIGAFTPMEASALSYLLSVCYGLVMCLLVFCLNMRLPYNMAYFSAIAVHVVNYRLLTAYSHGYSRWSLLGGSLLSYHSIGGSYGMGLYFTLGQWFCIYGGLLVLLLVLLLWAVQGYDFKITVGDKQ